MIILLLLFLPASACLFWVILNYFVSRRTSTFGILSVLMLALGLFLMVDSLYRAPGLTAKMLVSARLIELFTAPCLVPLVWLYLHRLKHGRKFVPLQYAWVILPLLFITVGGLLTNLAGVDNVATFLEKLYSNGPTKALEGADRTLKSYYFWTAVLFRIVVGIELLVGLIMLIRHYQNSHYRMKVVWDFFHKGEKCSIMQIQVGNLFVPAFLVLLKLGLLNSVMDQHVWLAVVMSLLETACVFNYCFTALFGAREKITLENMKHVMVYNYNPKIKSIIVEFTLDDMLEDAEQEGLRRLREKIGETLSDEDLQNPQKYQAITEHLFATMANTWDEDSLLSRFQNLMLNEQLFLKPSLSLQEVADRLHTNKTYVSKLVNNTYNLGFPELLNTLRVDYAEQYILGHRSAKQTQIAEACGFSSASSFNNIFKKITGVTPKVWISSLDQIKTAKVNGKA